MSRPFSDYTNVFFWNFKRMDNVNYNFEIVEILYKSKKQNGNNNYFNKPIILIIISMIECILYDFVRRVNEHSNEIIPNIDSTVVFDTRTKIIDQLEPLIAYIRKNNLLRISGNDSIYDDLGYLRKARNRIHIQNMQQQLSEDEFNVFTNSCLKLSEKSLERICEVLCHVYPRPNREFCSMSDFPRPWT